MPGCETGTGACAQRGENFSLNCCRRLAVRSPFRIPLPQPAASRLPRDCCSNNWWTQKRFRKRTFATCWASFSILFSEEIQCNPRRFESICNEIVGPWHPTDMHREPEAQFCRTDKNRYPFRFPQPRNRVRALRAVAYARVFIFTGFIRNKLAWADFKSACGLWCYELAGVGRRQE